MIIQNILKSTVTSLLDHVKSQYELADLFTKALRTSQFFTLTAQIENIQTT